MKVRAETLLAVSVSAPLALVYAAGLVRLASYGLGDWGTLARLVLATMLLRIIVIMGVRRLRDGNPVIVMDLMSLEMLCLPVLAFSGLLLKNHGLIGVGAQVFEVWPSALLVAGPIYGIYEISAMIRRSASLTYVIPTSLVLFYGLDFLLSSAASLSTQPSFPSLVTIVSPTSTAPLSVQVDVVAAAVALYVSLVIFSMAGGKGATLSLNPPLVLGVAGTAAAIFISALVAPFGSSASYLIIVPAFALVAATWTLAHVR